MVEKEPWRIDKQSVHWRVLKGWLSERFIKWLKKKAEEFNVSRDDLLIEIIETIRRISWLTLDILEKETGKKVYLPFIVILDDCFELAGLRLAILKNNDPDFFCNPEKVKNELGISYLAILLHRIRHYLKEINGGMILFGTGCDFGIAIYDKIIINLIDRFSSETQDCCLEVVIEETFHYFSKQTNEFNDAEMVKEIKEARQNIIDNDERERIGQEIEEKYGVKKKRDEILRKLKKENKDLFFLLSKRIIKDTL